MALFVREPGFMTSVQDLGRTGYERFGVPSSGAMDWFALRAANRLVGNPPDAAALEFTVSPPVLEASEACLVAACGRGFRLWVQDRSIPLWMAAWVRRGEQIHFAADGSAGWVYLAVAGGIAVEPVLGSRSTYLRSGFGGHEGRLLQAGDTLPVGDTGGRNLYQRAGIDLKKALRPDYQDDVTLPVLLGPQEEAFETQGLDSFLSTEFTLRPDSDRMGYRLQGTPVQHRGSAEILSEGMAPGSVQIPPDGQPIVMMSDRPTTGGYPKIATVVQVGLPFLAQLPPGAGRVRFRISDLLTAQDEYRAMLKSIDDGIEE
jgi:antagonist of KipI